MVNPRPQTVHLGHVIIKKHRVGSTNEELKEIVRENSKLDSGFTVVAEYQTKGRGQGRNQWISESGKNAMFSVFIRLPQDVRENIFLLNFAVSLGVRAAVQKKLIGQQVEVKWPNDIMVGGKKVAGILIENTFGAYVNSIIGVGVNVNQNEFGEMSRATSIASVSGNTSDIDEFITDCLEYVEKYINLMLNQTHLQQIRQLYVSQLYKLDETVQVDGKDHQVIDVDAEGKLILRDEGGKQVVITHNEKKIEWT